MNANLTSAQREAIAEADAHVSNAGLPSYSELQRSLKRVLEAGRGTSGRLILEAPDEAEIRRSVGVLVDPPEYEVSGARSTPVVRSL